MKGQSDRRPRGAWLRSRRAGGAERSLPRELERSPPRLGGRALPLEPGRSEPRPAGRSLLRALDRSLPRPAGRSPLFALERSVARLALRSLLQLPVRSLLAGRLPPRPADLSPRAPVRSALRSRVRSLPPPLPKRSLRSRGLSGPRSPPARSRSARAATRRPRIVEPVSFSTTRSASSDCSSTSAWDSRSSTFPIRSTGTPATLTMAPTRSRAAAPSRVPTLMNTRTVPREATRSIAGGPDGLAGEVADGVAAGLADAAGLPSRPRSSRRSAAAAISTASYSSSSGSRARISREGTPAASTARKASRVASSRARACSAGPARVRG